jgi:hypothetical protein
MVELLSIAGSLREVFARRRDLRMDTLENELQGRFGRSYRKIWKVSSDQKISPLETFHPATGVAHRCASVKYTLLCSSAASIRFHPQSLPADHRRNAGEPCFFCAETMNATKRDMKTDITRISGEIVSK